MVRLGRRPRVLINRTTSRASSVIHGTISNVPAIGVAAKDNERIRLLGTCNLEDQVLGWHVRESVSLEVELNFHALASSLHAGNIFESSGVMDTVGMLDT
jgi:hypothetical protein